MDWSSEQWLPVAYHGESTMTSLGFEEYARGKCGLGVKVYLAGFPNGGREVASCSWARCVSYCSESSIYTRVCTQLQREISYKLLIKL